MSDSRLPRASRRAALGGVLVGLSAAGCDALTSGPRPAGPTSAAPASDASEDPDAELVERVRREVGETAALLRAAADRHQRLAAELHGFRRLHRRHLAALPGEGRAPARRRLRGDVAAVRSRVRAAEHKLQTSLADAAVAARSGSLAALLASMSAAVAQQLAVPSEAGRG